MSDGISRQLQKLDAFLCSEAVGDDAMLLSELDGFLTGIVVCPELIEPSVWLPQVWGDVDPVFDSEKQMRFVVKAIMDHYNDIVRNLEKGNFGPIYDIDTDDSYLWETWIAGFGKAVFLRPEAWAALEALDDELTDQAFSVLMRLLDLDQQPAGFEPMETDEALREMAPDAIGMSIDQLYRARLQLTGAHLPAAGGRHSRVGRNDPCPCGSGMKFKKCSLGKEPDAEQFPFSVH